MFGQYKLFNYIVFEIVMSLMVATTLNTKHAIQIIMLVAKSRRQKVLCVRLTYKQYYINGHSTLVKRRQVKEKCRIKTYKCTIYKQWESHLN